MGVLCVTGVLSRLNLTWQLTLVDSMAIHLDSLCCKGTAPLHSTQKIAVIRFGAVLAHDRHAEALKPEALRRYIGYPHGPKTGIANWYALSYNESRMRKYLASAKKNPRIL